MTICLIKILASVQHKGVLLTHIKFCLNKLNKSPISILGPTEIRDLGLRSYLNPKLLAEKMTSRHSRRLAYLANLALKVTTFQPGELPSRLGQLEMPLHQLVPCGPDPLSRPHTPREDGRPRRVWTGGGAPACPLPGSPDAAGRVWAGHVVVGHFQARPRFLKKYFQLFFNNRISH